MPSTGEDDRESPDPSQEKLPFFLWNCCRVDNPEGVEERCLSVVTVGGCEADFLSSLVLPDQLKTPRPKLAGLEE